MYKKGSLVYFSEDFDYKLTLSDEKMKVYANKPYKVLKVYGTSMTVIDPQTNMKYFIYEISPSGERDGGWDKLIPLSIIREQKINELIF